MNNLNERTYDPMKNNYVELVGTICSGLKYSHEIYGEKFYVFECMTVRLNGETADTIPVMVSDRMIDVNADHEGRVVRVLGNFRSFNKHTEDNRSKVILSVFAREFYFEDPEGDTEIAPVDCINTIELEGYICKPPVFRTTPLGREIADLFIAVNRPYGKSDYIPCIAWGRNAKFVSGLPVGAHVSLRGRIQSRKYNKHLGNSQFEERVAYEVSVHTIQAKNLEENKEDNE